jgi:cholesterol transport system auxiliary component
MKILISRPLMAPLLLVLTALLSACALPERAPAPQRYDFGLLEPVPDTTATRPALALSVQATAALDSPALLYRLAYADAQQLRAYGQARWAALPADLLQQRLRAGLDARFAVVPAGEGASRLLYIELEEFSQVFTTAQQSQGLLRLRASLLQRSGSGQQLLAQRVWRIERPAPTPDAQGGVRALAAASAAVAEEVLPWLLAQP